MSHHGNDIYWESKLEAMMEEGIMAYYLELSKDHKEIYDDLYDSGYDLDEIADRIYAEQEMIISDLKSKGRLLMELLDIAGYKTHRETPELGAAFHECKVTLVEQKEK